MANQQTNQTANQQLKDQLDSYKSRISKSRKRKRIAFIAGFCLVAVAIVGLVLPAATLEYGKTYCGQEEHTHTDACVNRTVICALPDTSNGNGHVHVPSCYDEQSPLAICGKTPVAHMHVPACVNAAGTELICGLDETVHMHTLACVDPTTNTFACDYEGKAHVHGVTCYSLGADGSYTLVCQEPSVGHVHTMLCLDPETGEVVCGQEEAIELSHVHTDACYEEELICGMEEHTHNELCYDEITEAIMKKDEESSAAKEAAEEVEGVVDGVAEGDLTAEEIAEAKDQGLLFENDDIIVVFDVPDKHKDDIQLTVTETDGEIEYVEAIDAIEEVDLADESVDDEAAQGSDNGEPTFFSEESTEEATPAAVTSDAASDAASAIAGAEPDAGDDEPAYHVNLHIDATLAGEPVEDIAALGITAKLQIKPKVIAPILAEIDYSVIDPEIRDKVGAEITVSQRSNNLLTASNSGFNSKQVTEVVATSLQDSAISVDVLGDMEIDTEATEDISFSVSYMAWVPVPDLDSSEGQLTVIDTTGANLPKNGEDPSLTTMKVNESGNIVMKEKFVDIYKPNEYNFFGNSKISKIDKVAFRPEDEDATADEDQAAAYVLTGIAVFDEGEWDKDNPITADSLEGKVIIPYEEGKTELTNDPQQESQGGMNYVLVKENSKIVLIYNTTDPTYQTFDSSFYDYDISDGRIYRAKPMFDHKYGNYEQVGNVFDENYFNPSYWKPEEVNNPENKGLGERGINKSVLKWSQNLKSIEPDKWDGHLYTSTLEEGINSSGNYGDSGTKLAFGNVNTGTGLGRVTWNGNELNKYNGKSYEGCTFGLVEGLDKENGYIQYAPGVNAPKLFNEGDAQGKIAYKAAAADDEKGSSLTFKRDGDTYTLYSAKVVDGTNESVSLGLDTLDELIAENGKSLWTNSFWPMDGVSSFGTNGHDVKFGGTATATGSPIELRFGPNSEKGSDYTFPVSDDGQYHNSYFGMHYKVDFKLTKDYCGPLDYTFFGDDDLWVFLDGKLIVDIGGVHSSVGEYANLWDYIDEENIGENGDDHTLSVFYTERGASGSTCYMNFTLPSVSNVSEEADTGSFSVTKNVSAAADSPAYDKEFTFRLELEDGGTASPNLYPYIITKGNTTLSSGTIGNNATFKLKDGQTMSVLYLPKGITYRVQEKFDPEEGTPPYNISWNYTEYSENGTITDSASGDGLGNLPKQFERTIKNVSAIYNVAFINTVPYELPATGGIGAEWFWIGGGALMVFAIIALRRKSVVSAAASTTAATARNIYASPSGMPESTYKMGRHRIWRDDGQTRKGGIN